MAPKWKIGLALIGISVSSVVHAEDSLSLLQKDCARLGGTMTSAWSCPSEDWHREGAFCEVKDPNGVPMVFNGCDVDLGGYGSIFHSACVKHDLCYHHEPMTSGKDKFRCDIRFYHDMITICNNMESPEACEIMANVYYQGVRAGGDRSWGCSKVPAQTLSIFLFEDTVITGRDTDTIQKTSR